MIGRLLQPEIAELIRARDFVRLRQTLAPFAAPDLAEVLADLDEEAMAVVLRILPHQQATEVFGHLEVEQQEKLVHALGSGEVAVILNALSADDRTVLLEELPAAVTRRLLDLLSPEQRRIATELLGYPRRSVGRRMTPHYVAIQQEWRVGEVLEHLRRQQEKREALNHLFVVNEEGRLVDYVRLRDVVVTPVTTPVVELLQHRDLAVRATDEVENAVLVCKKYDVTMLPVVDSAGVLLGVVTVDDLLDVAERAATEDMQKLGGVETLPGPYLKSSLTAMIQKRAGWLALLFVGEMLTATAMGYFEDEIARAVVLALFVPLIISSGGNSGSQATSLIIRALALREITLRDWWRVMWREVVAGLALGGVLALIALARILLWPHRDQIYGEHYLLVALTVACSLIGVVLFGSVVGAMLPFVLRRLGLDPAVSSAPLVATLVDVTGLVIYFSIAFHILRGTLL